MKIYLVGGAVRDQLLGRKVVERDYLVVGASVREMLELGFKQVGRDFPVFLHPVTHEEYALARTERKTGRGYLGFTCFTSPDITVEEDLLRRDLTINAMAVDLETGELIDPFNGRRDLNDGILRHVSSAFQEDPVRILRVARFAARLNFKVAPETLTLMQQMVTSGEVDALTVERVWQEFLKALKTDQPSMFLKVLDEAMALNKLFSELTSYLKELLLLTESKTFKKLNSPLERFLAIASYLSVEELKTWAKRHKMPKIYLNAGLLAQQFKRAPKMFWPEDFLEFLTNSNSFRHLDLAELALNSLTMLAPKASHLKRLKQVLAICRQVKLFASTIYQAKQNGKVSQLNNYLYQKRRWWLYNALLN